MLLMSAPLRHLLLTIMLASPLCTAVTGGAPTSRRTPKPYMNGCVSRLPFCNTSLSVDERLDDLISRLTLDEKISQLSTNSFTHTAGGITPGIPRLHIPSYNFHTEGLHGLRDSTVAGFSNSTLFPQVTGMAATGNLTLVKEMGRVMATEGRAINNVMRRTGNIVTRGGGLSIYGPTINLIRSGRWGRDQETVSEDPWLSGAYAAAYIGGIQGHPDGKYLPMAATCKHLDAYSMETNRHDSDARVSELDLVESYRPAFQACVAAGAAQVMCSYNKVNGVPSCANGPVLNDVLRGQWGFSGLVVSDCDAIKDITTAQHALPGPNATAAGLLNGCDQDCGNWYGTYSHAALADNLMRQSDIDLALRRIFRMRFLLGDMGETDDEVSPWRQLPGSVVGSPLHLDLALQASRESIVLLKNSGGLLPLDLSARQTLAVIGPLANDTAVLQGSKQDYDSAFKVSVLQGLQDFVGKRGRVVFSSGLKGVTDNSTQGFASAEAIAKDADVTILVLGIDETIEAEGKDRSTLSLPTGQLALLEAIMRTTSRLVVVFINGGPVSCDLAAEGVATVVEAFCGGQFAGVALAEMLFGRTNPSGVLPFTIYAENATEQLPFTAFQMRSNASYYGRTYRFSRAPVLFPFGHGLSYTSFKVEWDSEVRRNTSPHLLHKGHTLTAHITNTGQVAGSKVVQAFVTIKLAGSAALEAPSSPLKSLFGIQKVHLNPGESRAISFSTKTLAGAAPFATVLHDGKRRIYPGKYLVHIGVHEEATLQLDVRGKHVDIDS